MNKIIATLLGLSLAAAVQAAPVSFQDIVDPADKKLSASGISTYSFTHNILDNGFLPSVHAINSAELHLSLADDGDADYRTILFFQIPTGDHETGYVTGDGWPLQILPFEVDNGTYDFAVSSLLLQSDGRLNVTLTALQGDFWFKSSTLDVHANNAPAAVPEPGTMALMGLGLLGMGLAYRRKA